jgi:hypothetical protein
LRTNYLSQSLSLQLLAFHLINSAVDLIQGKVPMWLALQQVGMPTKI